MIYILIALIALLTVVIVGLSINYCKAKRNHARKVGELHSEMDQLTRQNRDQQSKLQLSNALDGRLFDARQLIDKDIASMQFDIIETLAKNNLIE